MVTFFTLRSNFKGKIVKFHSGFSKGFYKGNPFNQAILSYLSPWFKKKSLEEKGRNKALVSTNPPWWEIQRLTISLMADLSIVCALHFFMVTETIIALFALVLFDNPRKSKVSHFQKAKSRDFLARVRNFILALGAFQSLLNNKEHWDDL